MTDKSNFPSGVEAQSTDFDNLNTQSAGHLKQRFIDANRTGVATGLVISRNGSDNTKFDVTSGRGYAGNSGAGTGNGEMLELATSVTKVSLADYTTSVSNVVCLVYTEAGARPRAHETNGTAPNTTTVRSARLKVFTTTQFAALPTTSTDMSVDALDRILVFGRIVGQGFASPGVPNALAFNQMFGMSNSVTFQLSPYSTTGPTPPTATGVEFRGPSMTTGGALPSVGTGQIRLVTSTNPPTLEWKSPQGGDAFGSTVNITVASSYSLVSNLGETMFVYASPELFPGSGTYTDNVDISQSLYTATAANTEVDLSAVDRIHRRQSGTVSRTSTNTHGTRGSDISPILRVQQGIVLGDGVPDDTAHSQMPRLATPVITTATRILLGAFPLASGVYMRYYLSRSDVAREETVNARWNGSAWTKDVNGTEASYKYSLGRKEQYYVRTAANNGTWASWDGNTELVYSTKHDDTTAQARGFTVPREYEISYAGASASEARTGGLKVNTTNVTTDRWLISDVVNTANSTHYRKYANLGATEVTMEETVNARWDGTNWNRDSSGLVAWKRTINTSETRVRWKDATASASWNDSSWGQSSYAFAITPGNTSLLQDGRVQMPWDTTTGNPDKTEGLTDTLCSKNLIKAWIRLNWTGSATVGVQEGFNIVDPPVKVGTGTGDWATRVTMVNGMVDGDHYAVVLSLWHSTSVTLAGAPYPMGLMVDNLTATTFDVRAVSTIGLGLDPASATLNNHGANIIVVGVQ